MFQVNYVNDGNAALVARVESALSAIPVHCTRVVFGNSVTRWNDEEVEVGTWGVVERMQTIEDAAQAFASSTNADKVVAK